MSLFFALFFISETLSEQEIYVGIPKLKSYLAQELQSFIGKDFLNNYSISILIKK